MRKIVSKRESVLRGSMYVTVAASMSAVLAGGCIKAKVEPLEVKHIYMTLDINIRDPAMTSALSAGTRPTTLPGFVPATEPGR